MFRSRTLIGIASAALITGCLSMPGDDLPPFGTNLRQTIEAQTYEDGDSTPTLNGDKAAKTMEDYRNRDAAPAGGAILGETAR